MRLLVVEDEARIGAFLARAFEIEGFTVDVVADGERGLHAALSGDYGFVILDLLLPGRDGLDVLRELHERRPDLPVLILSARSDLATKLRGFELGAVDYLAKPFSLDELFARIRVQMRVGHARSTPGRRCGWGRWCWTSRAGRPGWGSRSPTCQTASSGCCTS